MAQTPSAKQALKNFRAEVLNTRLVVEGFGADTNMKLSWTSDYLSIPAPRLRVFGVYTFDDVQLGRNSLELSGTRATLVKDKNGNPELLGSVPVTIQIALNGGNPAQVLPALKSQLFYPSIGSAMAAIPASYARFIPGSLDSPQTYDPQSPPSACSAAGAKYERPKTIRRSYEVFSGQPPTARFNGKVTGVLTVDEKGRPTDLWLATPAGIGIDEEVAKSMAGYFFTPSTCDGKPIRAVIQMTQNFNMQ